MSTIASPREASLPRRMPSGLTPTSSTRPSLDVPRSPNPSISSPSLSNPPTTTTRRNRAALREYYNLPKSPVALATPSVEVTDPLGIQGVEGAEQEQQSEVAASELDAADFSAEAYVARALAESGLEELLRLYTRVVGETRALDAEKKALVYDNYSKLISATETIRKMRSKMDPLNPMASTLDPAIAQIYTQATAIRDSLRASIPTPPTTISSTFSTPSPFSTSPADDTEEVARQKRRLRTKQLALEVLETPDKLRALVAGGRAEEARRMWETPRRLLLLWREKGLGGPDVEACVEDGDAALRGEGGKERARASGESRRVSGGGGDWLRGERNGEGREARGAEGEEDGD
ncbi:hypothetical protein DL764_001602 [Monosporascus ibericus]|uniref:Vacuolar protein sorting-associated protein 51 homolog n=1 Tax=Monosporascus ibericus TaxID=155417 RepID=A0A4Q4TQH0_9PEZI|nr:hypothetical protein DL764_001602 [Monosporascus ibericus]